MKQCSKCYVPKEISEFKSREDNFGYYSWCDPCRVREGRDRVSESQMEYLKKTQFFTVRGGCDSVQTTRYHESPPLIV